MSAAIEAPDRDASIFERLACIVAELPAIGKGEWNQQQSFAYRGHDQVMNALNPLLSKYGVFFAPHVLERITDQRKTSGGKVMFEVNLHVQYTFYGPKGDSFTASAWGEGTDMGDKSTNKAMTMALKNVIAQTFAVSTEEQSLLDTDRGADEPSLGRASAETRSGPDPVAPNPAAAPATGAKRPSTADRRLNANLMDELKALDPAENWDERMQAYVLQRFEGKAIEELTQGEYRFLNQRVEGIRDELVAKGNAPGAFPPPTDEERDQALLEAGIDPSDAPVDDDIPFGEPSPADTADAPSAVG